MKRFLRVPIFTPNMMIYGDTGRHELWINSTLRSIKYWLKILRMDENRYVRKVYNMMLHDDCCDNWAGKIKKVFFRFDFIDIWESQQIGNQNLFLKTLKERMINVSDTNWLNTLYGSDRYSLYRTFKQVRYKEPYLDFVDNSMNRKLLSCFRMGVSNILSHRTRFNTHVQIVCPLCIECEEDDVHFLLQCPVYYDLRLKYLFDRGNTPPNLNLFQLIMQCDEEMSIKKLSLYLYYAFKRRNVNIDEGNIVNI